ncbi:MULTISPECIES: 6-carboxytetrahydropterin synthase [Ideonella]|jgi:6-pyruvoyltetrahydropterin/6-carboxytetrahydropterin synthase|uniref:6-carboxy-5,6,7,8-tetrahydropterin synthase n=2 Tax=Ideonella TaxID=36862 RepID=A0A643FAG0_IDEDE|nr:MULTISPECIES: 6-carboxytetrahydropterin synthase [Ideonella]KAB0579330.1 6-carboxytetrahydropterin synthase [Ideonella dechloratans]MCO5978183.1 6-carboxytetrahydropterin synthase [Ideonella oryzae]UFU09756.1 6-carboxytetrahydropterin synthase [Ideonella dechloratans]
MQYELSQTFYFEAAHTLRRTVDVEPSLRIHGHTYIAEITLAGAPDDNGMVVDLAYLRRNIETLRRELDHRFLDEVAGLGPATLENLCAYIWRAMELVYAGKLSCVEVRREASGDRCRLRR